MDMTEYVTVADRLRMAHDRYPDLRVQEVGHQFQTIGDQTILMVTVSVWRTADDPMPAVATASEPYPGRTPYTRGSEYMNGSTSALGRCLVYMGFGTRHMASRDEVEQAQRRFGPDDKPETYRDNERPSPTVEATKRAYGRPTPATPKQLAKLRGLRYSGPVPATALDASRLIDTLLSANGEVQPE